MEKYVKPAGIQNDMGGGNDEPDHRMAEIFRLLEYAPFIQGRILDIGVGRGQISRYFLENPSVTHVEGIGLEVDSYGLLPGLEESGLHITECAVEKMPFENENFDIAVTSHVLEHVPNMGLALQEIRRVLKDGGYLYIFIPRYSSMVLAGHINTGWNIGQLMYILLLSGFDVKHGSFIEYGYSLCAFVQKKDMKLPVLRGDRGDIALIDSYDLLPRKIKDYGCWEDGLQDGFFGEITSMNWNHAEELLREKWDEERAAFSRMKKISAVLAAVMIRLIGKEHARGFADLLNKMSGRIINPDEL